MTGASNSIFMMTGIVTALASAGIGIFWALMNIRYNKSVARKEEEKRFEKYGHYLLDKQRYIERVYAENSKALKETYVSSQQIVSYDASSDKLWNRNFTHSDVLTYRLGLGDIPFPGEIQVTKSRFSMVEDALADKAQMLRDRFRYIRNAPVCIDLKEQSLTGVIGERNAWLRSLKI